MTLLIAYAIALTIIAVYQQLRLSALIRRINAWTANVELQTDQRIMHYLDDWARSTESRFTGAQRPPGRALVPVDGDSQPMEGTW